MEALDSTTRLNHEEKIEWRGGYNWRGHTGESVLLERPWPPPADRKGDYCKKNSLCPMANSVNGMSKSEEDIPPFDMKMEAGV